MLLGVVAGVINVGDVVLRLKDRTNQPKGTTRFDSRWDGTIYRVHNKFGRNTFELCKLTGEILRNFGGSVFRVSGDQLVKCDMPELSLQPPNGDLTRLEIQNQEDHNVWLPATLLKLAPDGRAVIKYDDELREKSIDLTSQRYRWLY